MLMSGQRALFCRMQPTLSPRQLSVLNELGSGQTNKSIGLRLGMSEGAVKVHLKAIYTKVGVPNRTAAAVWAERWREALASDRAVQAPALEQSDLWSSWRSRLLSPSSPVAMAPV
jgi:DNA-binding CsgD family transcriptional regulator